MRLSIQVRLDGLSFFTQDLASATITAYQSFPFSKKVDPAGLLKEIKDIFDTEPLLSKEYKEVDVIYVNTLFSLVPLALFEEDTLSDYLKFNTKILETDFVAYDRLEAQELVNVFIPYANVNNFFFDQYGSFSYHHCLSSLIAKVLQESSLNQEASVHLNVHNDSFEMIVVLKKQLLFANIFEFHTAEDFIYYLLFTLEQLALSPETISVECSGEITEEDDTYKIAYRYIRNISLKEHSVADLPRSAYLLSTLL